MISDISKSIPVLILNSGITTMPSISVMVTGKVFEICGIQSKSSVLMACPSK